MLLNVMKGHISEAGWQWLLVEVNHAVKIKKDLGQVYIILPRYCRYLVRQVFHATDHALCGLQCNTVLQKCALFSLNPTHHCTRRFQIIVCFIAREPVQANSCSQARRGAFTSRWHRLSAMTQTDYIFKLQTNEFLWAFLWPTWISVKQEIVSDLFIFIYIASH